MSTDPQWIVTVAIDPEAPEDEADRFIDAVAEAVHSFEPRTGWDPHMSATKAVDPADEILALRGRAEAAEQEIDRLREIVNGQKAKVREVAQLLRRTKAAEHRADWFERRKDRAEDTLRGARQLCVDAGTDWHMATFLEQIRAVLGAAATPVGAEETTCR